jgi:biopolymer transport protein ExbD
MSNRRRRLPRGAEPESGPELQVAPMLDMAFQLLAFFILTYRPPSAEARIDLDLPRAPVALPGASPGRTNPGESTSAVEDTLTVIVRSDEGGRLASLKLDDLELKDLRELGNRLARYKAAIEPKPLRVIFRADERLKYEEAARIVETCSSVGLGALSLAEPEP